MDYSKLGNAAAESDDLTVSKSFERELPRAGVALLRLRDYIETGRHVGNTAYKPSLKCMFVFELSHPDHLIEIDGKKVPSIITVRSNKGATNKSGYKKLFNVMNAAHGNKFKHFAQMIGEAFLGEIVHNKSADGKTTYANLDRDGAWTLKAPEQVDALTNTKTDIPVRELDGTPRVFLWENKGMEDADITEMWESIFIDGEREVEKDGVKSMVSKNWIQEIVMANLEWEGSVTQALTQEHVSIDLDAPAEGDASAELSDLAQNY